MWSFMSQHVLTSETDLTLGIQATANSLRSYLAPALSRA